MFQLMSAKVLEFLNQGWVGSILGIAGIVIGGVISWFFFKRSEQIAIPAFTQDWFLLVGYHDPEIDGLEVKATFHGVEVTRLIRSELRFWNAGNKTLEGSTIVSSEPLRLELATDEKFLSAKVVHSSRTVNGFRVEIPKDLPNTLLLTFDFLDGGDGAVIECYHNSKKFSPTVKGVFKGIPNGILRKAGPDTWGTRVTQQKANTAMIFGLIILVVTIIFRLNGYTGWWPIWLALIYLLGSILIRAPYPDTLQFTTPEKNKQAK